MCRILFEETTVVVLFLATIPSIKSFFLDHQAQFRCNLQGLFTRRVVGRPDRIDSHVLHLFETTVLSLIIFLSSEGPMVMVKGYPVEFRSHPIEEEATFWRPVEIAVTKAFLLHIDQLRIPIDPRIKRIKGWVIGFDIPEGRFFNMKGMRQVELLTSQNGLNFTTYLFTDHLTILIDNFIFRINTMGLIILVDNAALHHCIHCTILLFFQLRGRNRSPILR